MSEKPNPLVLEALNRAVADPLGVPLHGSKAAPGLFAATATAKLAAQTCKDDGYLRVVRTETRGKTAHEICAITEKGLAYLLTQASPRQVLEECVRALQARQAQIDGLIGTAQQTQAGLEAFRALVEKVLSHLGKPGSSLGPAASHNGTGAWPAAIVTCLSRWQSSAASEDCPLPKLYHEVEQTLPGLTIGHFHDSLRQLHERGQIYLHPWTGPLYEIPEPAYALLAGHEIAYYVSLRQA